MPDHRIFVEKRPGFRAEAESLRRELNENLQLNLKELRLINVYDLFGFSDELLSKTRHGVFGEVVTDEVSDGFDAHGGRTLAIECLPGQFDQRAASAEDCVRIVEPTAKVRIKSSRLMVMDPDLTDEGMAAIRHYMINTVESREKDLSVLALNEDAAVKPPMVLDGFLEMDGDEAAKLAFCSRMGLAMNSADLQTIIDYFKGEGRIPTETELRILDTYWSDHCRHTTFTTRIEDIRVEEGFLKDEVEGSLRLYLRMRDELGRRDKPVTLMDIATIGAKYLRSKGLLDDMEVSEENNACSIYVDAVVDGKTERWLLMFKNETHNHPTEIEPFGGAATCLGGAIRDPLSGRSYVYQAMRITGAGDVWKSVKDTLPGKLPQRVISRKAAQGYSSYGNQIGLATGLVHEIIDPGYTAKRMEIGAVAGAVKASAVRRESPVPGDVVLMLGGRTGRDGIGGATGSSKEHDEKSLDTCGSEVQKGNPAEERKLQRLFRRPEAVRLIKKSNDFGAGGVSVAIGELADGLDIHLDRVPVKYSGLNCTELAISESQERMAVVVSPEDKERFMEICHEENVEVTHVADVTDTARMRMFYKGEAVADMARSFIDTAGASRSTDAFICSPSDKDPFAPRKDDRSVAERMAEVMSSPEAMSEQGLGEMFDSTVGRSNVLMPYGGATQKTAPQVSVYKFPADGYTDTASLMSWGYDPKLSEWSPYHGAAYAVVEACAKAVAAGASWEGMRFSYQEYFERMTHDPKVWGKPLSALLGALKMQEALGLPAIGGKDSMSGTFEDRLMVPPTLVAFGVAVVDAGKVISPEFKQPGDKLYLYRHKPLADHMPDTDWLKSAWDEVHEGISSGKIVAAYAPGRCGAAEALAKMSFGNRLGAKVGLDETALFGVASGSILVEAKGELGAAAEPIGEVIADKQLVINGESMEISDLLKANEEPFSKVYRLTHSASTAKVRPDGYKEAPAKGKETHWKGGREEHPRVYLPVFPGTNCDYDMAKAFRTAGARTSFGVFRNLSEEDIFSSIDQMRESISRCHILAFSGGFSSGDEPDGSGKFIANVICNPLISAEIQRLLDRGGLIIGICNGFQALVKSGLLPYGKAGSVGVDSPTLFRNDIGRHVSRMATVRVASVASPWLSSFSVGDCQTIAMSHGEGKFVVGEELARKLFDAGQVAFQYADPTTGEPTMESPDNPNGSCYAIEGIISPDGQIFGEMGHPERWERNLFRNIPANLNQPLFENAVRYFRG